MGKKGLGTFPKNHRLPRRRQRSLVRWKARIKRMADLGTHSTTLKAAKLGRIRNILRRPHQRNGRSVQSCMRRVRADLAAFGSEAKVMRVARGQTAHFAIYLMKKKSQWRV